MRSCLRTVLLLALACCAGLAPSTVVSACSEACAASGHCGNGGLLPGAVLTDLEALDMALQNEQGRVAQAPWTAGRPVLNPVIVKHLIPLMYQCYAEMLQDIAADNDPASLQKTYQEYTRQDNLPQAQQKMFQAYSGQMDVLAVIQRLMLLQGRVQDPQWQFFTNAVNSLLHAPAPGPSETPAEQLKGAYVRAWKLRFVASAPGAAQQIASTDAFIRNILPAVTLDRKVQSIKTTLKQNIASGTYDAALEQRIAALPSDRRNEVEEFRKQEQAAKYQQVREALELQRKHEEARLRQQQVDQATQLRKEEIDTGKPNPKAKDQRESDPGLKHAVESWEAIYRQELAQKKARATEAQNETGEKQAWQAAHAKLVHQSGEIQSALQSLGYRAFCHAKPNPVGDPMIACGIVFSTSSIHRRTIDEAADFHKLETKATSIFYNFQPTVAADFQLEAGYLEKDRSILLVCRLQYIRRYDKVEPFYPFH
jgi:hypothetical protein